MFVKIDQNLIYDLGFCRTSNSSLVEPNHPINILVLPLLLTIVLYIKVELTSWIGH